MYYIEIRQNKRFPIKAKNTISVTGLNKEIISARFFPVLLFAVEVLQYIQSCLLVRLFFFLLVKGGESVLFYFFLTYVLVSIVHLIFPV